MANLMRSRDLRQLDPFAIAAEMLRWSPFAGESAATGGEQFMPSFDVVERENAFEICADMPGIGKDDLDITVTGNQVQISGERRSEVKPEDSRYHVYERYHGKFTRTFSLPAGADAENIDANLEEGVLTLRIPKKEEAKSRKVSLGGGKPENGKQKKLSA